MSRGPILMRYSVKVVLYDNNGNVTGRNEHLFRLRRQAEKYARDLRRNHNQENISSFIRVVKLEDGSVVEIFKSKKYSRR